jgi:hypothetical protein
MTSRFFSAIFTVLMLGASNLWAADIAPLKLAQADLIESLVFKRRYCTTHPQEDAIIVTAPGADTPTQALVVYTQTGRLFVRVAGKDMTLAGLDVGDIDRREALSKQLAELWSTLPLPAEGDAADQLRRAYGALSDREAVGIVPVSKSKGSGSSVEQIHFDWSGSHYSYHPDSGLQRQPNPVDPITGEPYLCVTGADALESRKFYYDYLRKYPGEKARFLLATNSSAVTGYAATAYTKSGKLFIFSPLLGHLPVEASYGVNDGEALLAYYSNLAFDKTAAATKFVPAAPVEFPGDTGSRQVARAYLMTGGNRIYERVNEAYVLGFKWQGYNYYYFPKQELVFHGRFAPHQISPLVEGLLFSVEYKESHPAERVVITMRADTLRFPRKPWALTVYTQGGDIYFYDAIVGRIKLDISPGLLEPEKRAELAMICQEYNLRAYRWQKPLRHEGVEFPAYDEKKMEVESVYATFKRGGIDVKKIKTRLRHEDGSFTEYDAPSLQFVWEGAPYTYNPEFGAYRLPGYFVDRVR